MICLLLSLISLLTVESLQAKWNGNVSLSNLDFYSYRRSTLTQVKIGQYRSYFLQSFPPNGDHYDGIFGGAYAGGSNDEYPTHQLGYFPIGSGWPALSALNGDFSCATGYIAASYLKLEEVRNDGRVIQTIYLNRLPWGMSNETVVRNELTWALLIGGTWIESFGTQKDWDDSEEILDSRSLSTNTTDQNEVQTNKSTTETEIHGMAKNQDGGSSNIQSSSSSSSVYGNLSVALLITGSNITGKLPSGLTMTPKSMKILLDISNFPYTQQQTSIRLTMQVVTVTNTGKTSTFESQSERRLEGGTGTSAVYMDQDLYAYCDGTRQLITMERTQLDLNESSWGMVDYQLSALKANGFLSSAHALHFTFPPSVRHLSFDSVLGIGTGPEIDSNASTSGGAHKDEEVFVHAPPTVDSLIPGVVVGSVIGAVLLLTVIILYFRQREYLAYFSDNNIEKPTGNDHDTEDHFSLHIPPTLSKEEENALVNREAPTHQYQAL